MGPKIAIALLVIIDPHRPCSIFLTFIGSNTCCLIATQNSFCICAFFGFGRSVFYLPPYQGKATSGRQQSWGDGHSYARALYHPAKIRTLILGNSDRYHLIRIYCDCHVIFGLCAHPNFFLCSRSIWPGHNPQLDPDPHFSLNEDTFFLQAILQLCPYCAL